MAKYDLTGGLDKDFTFSINGDEFVFRKPTVREMRELAKRFSAIDKEDDSDEKATRSQEAMDDLFTFITNNSNDRYIGEVLDEQPVDVQSAFMNMIQEELTKKKSS